MMLLIFIREEEALPVLENLPTCFGIMGVYSAYFGGGHQVPRDRLFPEDILVMGPPVLVTLFNSILFFERIEE